MATRVGYVPFAADRYVPFVRIIAFWDLDLTGADIHAQVRSWPDQPGEPIWDLPKVTDGNLLGLQMLGVQRIGSRIVSLVRLHIPEVEMRAHAPEALEIAADVNLAWDLILTINQFRRRVLAGPFIIKPGVTQ